MNIIRESELVQVENYGLSFEWKDEPGAGFSFSCTKEGELIVAEMSPLAHDNYVKCMSGEYPVVFQGVKNYYHSYFQPAIGRCECGKEIVLARSFTNECTCGRLYNGFGQLLAPRSQWTLY